MTTFMAANQSDWLVREILNYWKRTLKRIDVTSRSLVALVEPGSAFAGTLAEIVFACDRAYMLDGTFKGDNRPAARMMLSQLNFGRFPCRTASRGWRRASSASPRASARPRPPSAANSMAATARRLGLVFEAFDEIDYADEVRIFLEERSGFSADGLTGLEANLRFGGPETMETKIFGRLTAWQNWIFNRPNATGENGALRRYGTGIKGDFNPERV